MIGHYMTLIFRYCLLLAIVIGACSTSIEAKQTPDGQYQAARNAYVALIKDTKKQQYRHHWDKVLQKLQRFAEHYPSHNKAPSAYYLLGKACSGLHGVSHLKKDAHFFNIVSTRYAQSSLADDSLYLQAEIEYSTLKNPEKARQYCEQILHQYPQGDRTKKARLLMKDLPAPLRKTFTVEAIEQSQQLSPAQITGIRHWTDNNHTRVVIELNHSTQFKVNTLSPSPKDNSSARLYLDLWGATKVASLASSYPVNQGVVERIRVGVNRKSIRVVCDLKQLTRYKVIELQNPPRIVIDIAREKGAVIAASQPRLESTPQAGQQDITTVLSQVPQSQPMRIHLPDVATKSKGTLRIVVDAGHGGKDPGAIGPNRLYEKDVVLKLAKKFASRLRSSLGCEVLLTRDRDVYIPLRQRTAYANEVGADLFISIHANASTNKKIFGIETFYLNFSKNDKAVAVAARENGMTIKEMGDLELILFDMMANAKINESSRLATDIQTSLITSLSKRYSDIKDMGVRQGPFHVLLGATMPSVLVEVAFISNKMEAKRLNSSVYRERAAEAIVTGVKKYLRSQNLLAELEN
ncbi:MAG: hypothetical protein B6I37_07425 [Desulfobacteraceae bacterium 4572_35.2]|nr:MAG: hypothetical protein B6I37_07425 [Desulfobacteraceae bacterium 4572_35.2]